tara:strand:- start:1445 stop:2089 length:645 start_codon:yes stop_codon:yes gene_type:complete
MLVNLYYDKLKYKDIEIYQSSLALIVSMWTSYTLYNYDIDNGNIFATVFIPFLSIDLFFIPINKIDIAIHHILIILLGYYVINTSKVYNNVVTTEILKTEISSIFLALNSVLKHPKLFNSTLMIISNTLFLFSFTYYRVLSLTYSVLFNLDYRLTIVNEFNKQIGDLNYKLNVLFLFLNYYWFYKICKLINRQLEKANFYNRLQIAFKKVMDKH